MNELVAAFESALLQTLVFQALVEFIILFIWNFVSIGTRHKSLFGLILKKM